MRAALAYISISFYDREKLTMFEIAASCHTEHTRTINE